MVPAPHKHKQEENHHQELKEGDLGQATPASSRTVQPGTATRKEEKQRFHGGLDRPLSHDIVCVSVVRLGVDEELLKSPLQGRKSGSVLGALSSG